MNVQQLIEMLSQEDPNSEVHFAYSSGDYWRTKVAPVVNYVEVCKVTYSNYHSVDKVMSESDDDNDEDYPGRKVVIIS